ncbi:MAG: glycosyltransferase [Cellvibrionales bacterium]|jgi:exo-beta-1,3-glucanase (GH17 family)/cellulose synthase/poly-beta-1,6-N-acetylglucosamine synthase-like glycosyltransferase|nr:glycosyltransferase [Cellvibrionales bacterium]
MIISHKTIINLAIVTGIAAVVIAVWAFYNRPMSAPDWPTSISGYAYSPYQNGQDPTKNIHPSHDEIRKDLALLSKQTHSIRTYSVTGTQADIPRLAQEFGMSVVQGIWISNIEKDNEEQIARAIAVINNNRNITMVVVGNESLYRREVDLPRLIDYIEQVRSKVKVPVTTAETWDIWLKYPELAQHVDIVTAHILPFWEKIPAGASVGFVLEKAQALKTVFSQKPLLLGEVGWPSFGRSRGAAEANQVDQAIYLRTLLNRLNTAGYDYFVIEAFDQLWKSGAEGDVGKYWGVYDVNRQPKFPFEGSVVKIPQWRLLAVVSVIMAILTLALLLIDSSGLKQRGRFFLAFVAFLFASFLVVVTYDYSQQYMTWLNALLGILLVLAAIGVFIVMFTEAHELAETVWAQRRRPFIGVASDDAYRPKVCIQVPCYNEPPDMVKETLNALAALDYPDFEVMIIDNNTKDENVWRPVEEYCKTLGPRFRFFHVAPLEGFKGGALNWALERTSPDAEIIAVIDSDYCVDPNWLKHLVPHFADPKIAIVQAPQDYRDGDWSLFKKLCYAEYKGFFHIGMVTRNDRNAIIQHGTMTMIRREVMDRLGWAEWTITEDAELGLRAFEEGLSAAYVSNSYGKGVMPDRFIDYKKQRFRWAYGAMQIMKGHFNSLFKGRDTKLTRGQRYHFIAGWMPWVADGMNLFFTGGALLWTAAMLLAPTHVLPPALVFALPPLILFFFKLGKILYIYKSHMKVPMSTSVGAAVAGLALSHTIAKSIIYGLFTKTIPFFRTPKMRDQGGFMLALAECREELFFLVLLWGAAAAMVFTHDMETSDAWAWLFMLLMQSLAYLAAVFMAFLSVLPQKHPE